MALNFQQSDSAFLRRVLLIVCTVASLAMVVVYVWEGPSGPLHRAQTAVSGAVAPLQLAGAVVGSGTDAAAAAAADFAADEATLTELRAYVAELEAGYAQKEEYARENERLRELLEIKDAYKLEGVGARVIGRSAQAWSQTITIDRGEADGVDAGQTVMGATGVVGQVVGTTAHTATVRLLTDPQSGAAAMVQSTRAEGVVTGSLEGLLYLEGLSADAEVQPGDIVLTSGLGGSYVKGLLIGTVVKVDARSGETTRRAVVSSNDGVSALEEVLVVFSVGAGLSAAPASDANSGSDSGSGSSGAASASSSSSAAPSADGNGANSFDATSNRGSDDDNNASATGDAGNASDADDPAAGEAGSEGGEA